jgi:hypothetical protein
VWIGTGFGAGRAWEEADGEYTNNYEQIKYADKDSQQISSVVTGHSAQMDYGK